MNAETETAIQNLGKAFADTADTMKRIANSLVNIELHLQAMRPSGVQTVRGPPLTRSRTALRVSMSPRHGAGEGEVMKVALALSVLGTVGVE